MPVSRQQSVHKTMVGLDSNHLRLNFAILTQVTQVYIQILRITEQLNQMNKLLTSSMQLYLFSGNDA